MKLKQSTQRQACAHAYSSHFAASWRKSGGGPAMGVAINNADTWRGGGENCISNFCQTKKSYQIKKSRVD